MSDKSKPKSKKKSKGNGKRKSREGVALEFAKMVLVEEMGKGFGGNIGYMFEAMKVLGKKKANMLIDEYMRNRVCTLVCSRLAR